MMEKILWALAAYLVWHVTGCAVLTIIDDEQQSLLKWADGFKSGGCVGAFIGMFVPDFFPIILFYYFKNRKDK